MATIEQALEWHKESRLEQAESAYRQILDENPEHADASNLLGMLLMQSGESDEAEGRFEVSCDRYPNNLSFLLNYASALAFNKKFEQSNSIYLRALSLGSDKADPNAHYGLFLAQMNRFQEAEPYLRKSVELREDDSGLWVNYGNTLRKLGQLDGAVAAFEQSVSLDDQNAIAWNCLGEAWQAKSEKEESIKAFEKALEVNPDYLLAQENLGLAYQSAGRISDSRATLEKAIQQRPDRAECIASLASVVRDQGQPEEAIQLFQRALELDPTNPNVVSKFLYTLNFSTSLSREEVEKAHLAINDCFDSKSAEFPARKERDGKLKIGFLSGDFCSHSVAFFLLPLLEFIDRERFEVHCFSNTQAHDRITERFQNLADGWFDTNGKSSEEVAAAVRETQIDALIDLAGHTAENRTDVLAESPAPIVLNWLGYPNRHGISSMYGRIVDRITDPKDHDTDDFSEKLVRLDSCFLCYSPGDEAPQTSESPALKNGYITFGSFNNAAKLNDLTIRVWSSILNTVPHSRLLLKSWQFEDADLMTSIRKRFRAYGIEEDRIRFSTRLKSYFDHMAAYSRIDVALDPFPYNGTTTTCEALWMGVPVVCLEGDRHAARVGASLLTYSGLDNLLAASIDDYIGIAAALAQDVELLMSLRQSIRPKLAASELCDGPGFATAFGNLIEDVLGSVSRTDDSQRIENMLSEALALQRKGQTKKAFSQYEEILEIDPLCSQANHYAGVALYAMEEYDRSVDFFRKALGADSGDAEILTHLGCSLQKAGRLDESVEAHFQAAENASDNAVILNNYGNALLESGKAVDAAVVYKRSLDIDPTAAQCWSNYGVALKQSGKLVEAIEAGEKAVELNSRFSGAYLNLGASYVAVGECSKGVSIFRKAVELDAKNAWAWSNLIYALQYSDEVTNSEIAEACRSFGELFPVSSKRPEKRYDGKRLRVGFVSGDFREHAVARFLLPLLRNKPSDRVSVFLYHDSTLEDPFTNELRTLSDNWQNIYGKLDNEVASSIEGDGIDFLIDLAGHSHRNRLGLFALRPAFAQATWLGFPGSTGLKAMDFRISDRISLTEEEVQLFEEAPLYLENGYHCIEIADSPAINPSPALEGSPFTFGSFNNLSKVGDKALSAWAEILRRAPSSRLLLKSYQLKDKYFREQFRNRLVRKGLPLDRITLLEPEHKYSSHLEAYRHVDLCLDPFPYNGTTTTCEALHMGVPVVSLLGERNSARVGASLLNQMSMDSFVCESVETYIDNAVQWSTRPEDLADFRTGLRGNISECSLGDGASFARDFFVKLEDAYRSLGSGERMVSERSAQSISPTLDEGLDCPWLEAIEIEEQPVGNGAIAYDTQQYGLPESFAGSRVLDASCIDGFWSVEALIRGAKEVTAIPAEGCFELSEHGEILLSRAKHFELCKRALNVSEDRMRLLPSQVYHLNPQDHGMFDWVFLLANANALRHLMFALDALRTLCSERLVLAMEINLGSTDLDNDLSSIQVEKGPVWLPSVKGLRSLIESASFDILSLKTMNLQDERSFAIIHARPV